MGYLIAHWDERGDGNPKSTGRTGQQVIVADRGEGCLFRIADQQMRNSALASALRHNGEVDHVVVVLCAPVGSRAICRRWAEARASLESASRLAMLDLPAKWSWRRCGTPKPTSCDHGPAVSYG
jgi:hypothetical protein